MTSHVGSPPYARVLNSLNPRDRLWLQRLAEGLIYKELDHSPRYVKVRMAAIRHFLGARTTTQAVIEAFKRGIIR